MQDDFALKGYDEVNQQFIVNDGNGEWFKDGYQDGSYRESLCYSLHLILSVGLTAKGPIEPARPDPQN